MNAAVMPSDGPAPVEKKRFVARGTAPRAGYVKRA